jgi:thiol-disulfide isomerase/thioredoxin
MISRVAPILLMAIGCASSTADLPVARVSARLEKIDGTMMSLAELRGRVVLVTFMATWSDPALLEVPVLKQVHASYPADRLAIVSVVLEDRKLAEIFAKTFEIDWIVTTAEDPAAITSHHGPFGAITMMPTSFVLDRDGRVVARSDGLWGNEVLLKILEEQLKR